MTTIYYATRKTNHSIREAIGINAWENPTIKNVLQENRQNHSDRAILDINVPTQTSQNIQHDPTEHHHHQTTNTHSLVTIHTRNKSIETIFIMNFERIFIDTHYKVVLLEQKLKL